MEETKLVVNVSQQSADLFVCGKRHKTYIVSTASKGLGCDEGSNKTPTGLFKISEKFGDGLEKGTVFKSRVPTGEICIPSQTTPQD